MGKQKSNPIPGKDYPRTFDEFNRGFSSEPAIKYYIFSLRWPDGFICPACHGNKRWIMAAHLIRCAGCKKKTSVIAGTIFQGTRKPLRQWFLAMWYMTIPGFEGNASELKDVLKLNSYQTAWVWFNKLNRAMMEIDWVKNKSAKHGLRFYRLLQQAVKTASGFI